VTVHPDAAPGFADGALATLESRAGALTVCVRHDARQRRDVALIPKGGHLAAGRCANVLIRARLTDMGEGGALYDERVRLRPLAGSVVVFLVADGSDDPAELARVVTPILNDEADLVIGSRLLGGAEPGAMTAFQRAGSAFAARVLSLRFGAAVTDLGPFRAIR